MQKRISSSLTAPYTYDLMPSFEDNFKRNNRAEQSPVLEIMYNGKYSNGGTWG